MDHGTRETPGRRDAAMRVLLVSADLTERVSLARVLTDARYAVTVAGSVAEAVAAIRGPPPRLSVVDHRLPDGEAADLLRLLAVRAPACRSVVISTDGTVADAVRAMRLGALDVLSRPLEGATLLTALRRDTSVPKAAARGVTLDEVQQRHIEAVVRDCGGDLARAASRLGLSRRTLQRWKRRTTEPAQKPSEV